MQKNKNSGFSMVEIIISVAIFSILIIPIISGIVGSMKNTTSSKTLQNRNEFAENLMEYVKTDTLENVLEGSYLDSIGSYTNTASKAATVTATFYTVNGINYDASLNDIKDLLASRSDKLLIAKTTYNNGKSESSSAYEAYPYEEYELSGKVNLGTDHKTYAYRMVLTNEAYAEAEKLSFDSATGKTTYNNPNNSSFGVVEDIDYKKIALINGTIANYDSSVSNAFLSRKIEALKSVSPDWFDMYTKQTSSPDLFPSDTVTRRIVIKVSGSNTTGYKVRCKLIYHDNCESRPEVKSYMSSHNMDNIEYTPFEYDYPVDSSTGYATLPNIYLMYNVCLYNNFYSPHDYIIVDTSELTDNPNENRPVNVFVVETAEKFSTALVDANTDLTDVSTDELKKKNSNNVLVKKNGKVLYNNNTSTGVSSRENVQVHILTTKKSADKDNLKNVHVYHNFDVTNSISDVNLKNSYVLYNSATPGVITSEISALHPTKDDGTVDNSDAYVAINGSIKTSSNKFVTGASVQSLDKAKEENRGLYQIKIWMQEGDDPTKIDIRNTSPILTATKGEGAS